MRVVHKRVIAEGSDNGSGYPFKIVDGLLPVATVRLLDEDGNEADAAMVEYDDGDTYRDLFVRAGFRTADPSS